MAQATFGFLLRLGFAVVHRSSTLIRFESTDLFVNIMHGRSSYLVGLELGRIRDGALYNLYEILSAFSPPELELSRCQVSEQEALRGCLESIASAMQRSCNPLLRNDSSAFDALGKVASAIRSEATREAQFGAVLERANRAWEQKNWKLALELYSQAESALNKTGSRRLAYLRKRRGIKA